MKENIILNETLSITYDEQSIVLKKKGSNIKICDDFCSKPMLNRNKEKLAFISPYVWEAVGKVFIYSIKEEEIFTVDSSIIPLQHGVKKVVWTEDDKLLLIIGTAFGTISVGGDVYIYSFDENDLRILYRNNENEEVKDFHINGNDIELQIVRFDEDFMNYSIELKKIQLND